MRELVKKNMKVRSIFLIICSLFCAHLAYSASCDCNTTNGAKIYTANGCSYTTQVCCRGNLLTRESCPTDCSDSKPNCPEFQLNDSTTPKASVYKAHAVTCTFPWVCKPTEGGWRSDMGTGTYYCTCGTGYEWDTSSLSCKEKSSGSSTPNYTIETQQITEHINYNTISNMTAAQAQHGCCTDSTGPFMLVVTGHKSYPNYNKHITPTDCPTSTAYYGHGNCKAYQEGNRWKCSFSYYEATCKQQ